MRLSTRIKSVSYLKANAAEILDELREQREPLIITQNGEAKAVLQDVKSYEETQETLALLKILALGEREAQQGRTVLASEIIDDLIAQTPDSDDL